MLIILLLEGANTCIRYRASYIVTASHLRNKELEHFGEIGMAYWKHTAEERTLDMGVSAACMSNSEGRKFL